MIRPLIFAILTLVASSLVMAEEPRFTKGGAQRHDVVVPDAGSGVPQAASSEPSETPWRAANALGSPPWLGFGATHRTRYEHLWNQFRAGGQGNDMAFSFRTTVDVEVRFAAVFAGAELIDSRSTYLFDRNAPLGDQNAPLDTTQTNVLEPVQAYVGAKFHDLFAKGAEGRVRAGRLALNVGSRRLVARNEYRNTTNAFTGLDLEWSGAGADQIRLLAMLPLRRLPEEREQIAISRFELDRASFGTVFWGAHYASGAWAGSLLLEAYVFGLHEQDEINGPTRNRQIITPGLRLSRAPRAAQVDLDVESAAQLGTSRATASGDDQKDLNHLAFFVHAAIGYTVDAAWRPRVLLQYDYASGDAAPGDSAQGRFDTLYGARRFDFGPTGIFGALARSNINSPGVRVEVRPLSSLDAMAGYRAVWLAQSRDAWTTSGIRDATGDAGAFVGHQVEAQLRWRVVPGNVNLDVGIAHLFLGPFPTNAPNSTVEGDPTAVYSQVGFEL